MKVSPSHACGHQVIRFMNGYAATSASDATPRITLSKLRLIRIRKLTRQQPMTNTQAAPTPIWPEAIGRPAVRATLASMSRSTMSL